MVGAELSLPETVAASGTAFASLLTVSSIRCDRPDLA